MKSLKILGIGALSASLLFGCSNSDETIDSKEEVKSKTTVDQKSLDKISADYRSYAIKEIEQFVDETKKFTDAVIADDIEKAKAIYPKARMHYERSEPIAEAFQDLDPKIDAREGDVPEEEWGGYHRIEKGLWEENTTEGYKAYAEQLMKDTNILRAKVETVDVTPDLLVTGAVDLLNEVSTSKITGEEDRYSHTDLYDFVANVQGAEKIYELFKPQLEQKDPAISIEVEQKFSTLFELLDKHKEKDGYIAYTELKESEVKELSEAVNELAEPLSQIGVVLEG